MLLLTPFAWAQFGSGFQGAVVDRSGGVVPAVAIRVTNIDTGVTREVLTGANGVYVVPSLSPGNYKVQALKEGFVSITQESLFFRLMKFRKVGFSPWRWAMVRQSVDVTGQATVLETEVGHVTSQLNQAALSELRSPITACSTSWCCQPGVTGRSMGVDNVVGRSTANVNFAVPGAIPTHTVWITCR